MSWNGDSPPTYANYPTPERPRWSPLTPVPSPPTRPPLPNFKPEPVDMDALLQHDPFRLAEEYGGGQITDRGFLFWVEGKRLPSLKKTGLNRYAKLDKAGIRYGRDFWSVVRS